MPACPKTVKTCLVLLLMGSFGALHGCQTPHGAGVSGSVDSPTPVQTSPESGEKRVSKEYYSIFFDRADHMKELIGENRFDDAARLYAEQKSHFTQNLTRDRALLKSVADHFNQRHAGKLAESLAALRAYDWPADDAAWPQLKADLAAARAAAGAYPDHEILDIAGFAAPDKAALDSEIARLDGAIEDAAADEFAAFDHFGPAAFFDVYPVELDRKPFLLAQHATIAEGLRGAEPYQLARFSERYGELLRDTPLWTEISNAYMATALSARGGGKAPGLVEILGALREVRAAGYAPSRIPGFEIGFIDVTSKTLLQERQVEFAPNIEVDLPIQASKADLDEALGQSGAGADYLIVFDIALAHTERRVSKMQKVPSRVLVGYKEEPNPEYNMAQNRVNQMQMQLQTATMNHAMASNQYCHGWGCLGAMVGTLAAESKRRDAEAELQQAMSALSSTPMTLQKPIYAKYKFNKATVKGSKVLTAHYYVIDRRRGCYFKETFDLREAKDFQVAYELQDEDPEKDKHLTDADTEQVVKDWEEAPVEIKLSRLVDHFVAHRGSSRKLPGLTALRREMLRDKNTALAAYKEQTFEGSTQSDPRFDSVVAVYRLGRGMGSGFFIRPDVVMTNYHVVEESEFVELRMYGGTETFGKVIARDAHTDLALIKVQARGKPVRFFARNKLELGATVEVIGHPKGLEFSITRGVVSAIREMTPINTRGSSKKVLHVQIDAATSPGNSGGPVFHKNRVVSVVSWGKTGKGVENLNFTVHHSVAEKFIARSLGAGS